MKQSTLVAAIDRHYRLQDAAASYELTSKYGSPLNALLITGDGLLRKAEEIAEVNLDTLHAEWSRGYEAFVKEAKSRREALFQQLTATPVRSLAEREKRNRKLAAYDRRFRAEARIAGKGINTETGARLRRLADAYATAIAEVRPLGEFPDLHPSSTPSRVAPVTEAASLLPVWWVRTASNRGALSVVTAHGRAQYSGVYGVRSDRVTHPAKIRDALPTSPDSRLVRTLADGRYEIQYLEVGQRGRPAGPDWRRNEEPVIDASSPSKQVERAPGTVWIRENRGYLPAPVVTIDTHQTAVAGRVDGFGTALHEVGHWLEHKVPGILAAEIDWLDSRSRGRNVRLNKSGTEIARGGNFPILYIGKRYEHNTSDGIDINATEVLSCGLEMIFAGAHGALLGCDSVAKADREMRAFILGLMAAIGFDEESRSAEPE